MSPVGAAAVEVFPAGAVPSNLLRWHLVFDRPANDVGPEAIVLVDRSGQPVRDAFVRLPEGLWDASGTRLTVLLHPGRIKTGLESRSEFGGALQVGDGMRLRIDLDQLLAPGHGEMEHRFVVQDADRRAIDPTRWRLGSVRAGSSDALPIGFDRAMDHLGVQEGLAVVGSEGHALRGHIALAPDGRSALFYPSQSWGLGRHGLIASHDLEDVAGNRVDAAFESSPHQAVVKSTATFFSTSSDEPIPRANARYAQMPPREEALNRSFVDEHT